MSTAHLPTSAIEATDPQMVFGMRYRWNYAYDHLEVMQMGESHWDTSAFSPHVRAGINGEPLECHDSERPKAEALIAVFAPIVRGTNATHK
jgi:hypothetical protein